MVENSLADTICTESACDDARGYPLSRGRFSPRHVLTEVQYFFSTYKDLEGKRVQIDGWKKSDEAAKVIMDSIARYDATYLRLGP